MPVLWGRQAMTETTLMFEIRHALVSTSRVMLWRSNTGFDRERKVHYGLGLGGPDLVGLLVGSGRFVGFEIKTPTGSLSSNQRAWHAAVRANGGFVAVVRCVDGALEALARAESGAAQ